MSVILFLGVSEIACRVLGLAPPKEPGFRFIVREQENDVEYPFMDYHPTMLWAPVPGSAWRHPSYGRIRINALGFRDEEYSEQKGPNVFRILCLGDSSTFGFGVPASATYPSLLETKLNAAAKGSGRRFEVINGGVIGYTSLQCLRSYEERGRRLKPDLVTLYVGPNDIQRRYLTDEEIAARAAPSAIVRVNEFFSNFHAYRALRAMILGRRSETQGPYPQRVGPEGYQRNIAELNRLCRSDNTRLALISFAHRISDVDRVPEEYWRDLAVLRQTLIRVAQDHSIPMVDLPEMTEDSADPEGPYFIDPMHPSAAGHRYIAEQLFSQLAAAKLIPVGAAE